MSVRILISVLMLITAVPAIAGVADSGGCVTHGLTAAVSGGYNLPSHGYYKGYNPAGRPIYANSSLHLEYAFGFTSRTRLGSLYPGVTQGIGLSVRTFYNPELMGTPVFAYIFQQGRIIRIRPCLGLDYKWDLGASCNWKKTGLIGSSVNIYVNVGLMMTWDISDIWTLSIGPEFAHCSNGDTFYPNGGANMLNLRAGVTAHLDPPHTDTDRSKIQEYESDLRRKSVLDRMEYDLILLGGWRAGKVDDEIYALINEKFPFFGINFMPMYRLNRHFSVGASIDFLADRSADIYDVVRGADIIDVTSWRQPPLSRQIAAGLSLRADIAMPIFTIGAGVGGFVLGRSESLQGIYSIFSLKAFVAERLFINVSYRLSAKNFTHNMMYGIGWRFN